MGLAAAPMGCKLGAVGTARHVGPRCRRPGARPHRQHRAGHDGDCRTVSPFPRAWLKGWVEQSGSPRTLNGPWWTRTGLQARDRHSVRRVPPLGGCAVTGLSFTSGRDQRFPALRIVRRAVEPCPSGSLPIGTKGFPRFARVRRWSNRSDDGMTFKVPSWFLSIFFYVIKNNPLTVIPSCLPRCPGQPGAPWAGMGKPRRSEDYRGWSARPYCIPGRTCKAPRLTRAPMSARGQTSL